MLQKLEKIWELKAGMNGRNEILVHSLVHCKESTLQFLLGAVRTTAPFPNLIQMMPLFLHHSCKTKKVSSLRTLYQRNSVPMNTKNGGAEVGILTNHSENRKIKEKSTC